MHLRPVVFLDFDQTVFDLRKMVLEYTGARHEDHFPRLEALLLADPVTDLRAYLFPDALSFITEAKKTHDVFILSRARSFAIYQRKKIEGSQILNYVDGLILTGDDDKGTPAKPYLLGRPKQGNIFIDDNTESLRFMKVAAPFVETIFMGRIRLPESLPTHADKMVRALLPEILHT